MHEQKILLIHELAMGAAGKFLMEKLWDFYLLNSALVNILISIELLVFSSVNLVDPSKALDTLNLLAALDVT
jgi:hypothetical protein